MGLCCGDYNFIIKKDSDIYVRRQCDIHAAFCIRLCVIMGASGFYERFMNSKKKRQVNLTLPGRLNQKLNSLDDGFWFYLSGLNYDNIYDNEA